MGAVGRGLPALLRCYAGTDPARAAPAAGLRGWTHPCPGRGARTAGGALAERRPHRHAGGADRHLADHDLLLSPDLRGGVAGQPSDPAGSAGGDDPWRCGNPGGLDVAASGKAVGLDRLALSDVHHPRCGADSTLALRSRGATTHRRYLGLELLRSGGRYAVDGTAAPRRPSPLVACTNGALVHKAGPGGPQPGRPPGLDGGPLHPRRPPARDLPGCRPGRCDPDRDARRSSGGHRWRPQPVRDDGCRRTTGALLGPHLGSGDLDPPQRGPPERSGRTDGALRRGTGVGTGGSAAQRCLPALAGTPGRAPRTGLPGAGRYAHRSGGRGVAAGAEPTRTVAPRHRRRRKQQQRRAACGVRPRGLPADGRHRSGGRGPVGTLRPAVAGAGAEGSTPRQRQLHDAGVPGGGEPLGSGGVRRGGQPLWAPVGGGTGTGERDGHPRLPHGRARGR